MTSLCPFWRYFGGKWRAAPRYPKPRYDTIIEPFAGAAGYSLRYPDRQVILVERYHVVAEIWRWLISATPDDVMAIPIVESTDDLPGDVPDGARWLVGFNLNSATTSPCRTLSAGRRKLAALGRRYEGWTAAKRDQVAGQVNAIKHWQVIEGDYWNTPAKVATYFVDPPYEKAGVHYKHSNIDYENVALWCRWWPGQVIVCEAAGATWLPFVPFADIKSFGAAGRKQTSTEVIWTNDAVIPSLVCTTAAPP